MSQVVARLLIGVSLLIGCSSGGTRNEATGSIDLALRVDGVTIDSVSYTITNPGYTKAGRFSVADSTRIAAVIGGIPVGVYTITLEATPTTTPELSCRGSASFEVFAHTTTTTHVDLGCKPPAATGSVTVNGEVVVCPTVSGLSAEPSETMVGGVVHVSTDIAEVPNHNPGSTLWRADGGLLSSQGAYRTDLTCTELGSVTVTFTIGEGTACEETQTVQVLCSASSSFPPGENPNTPGDDRAGYVACGDTFCTPGFGCCGSDVECVAGRDRCTVPYWYQDCDGPEDCDSGLDCSRNNHSTFMCGGLGPGPVILKCHDDADCPPGAHCAAGICGA